MDLEKPAKAKICIENSSLKSERIRLTYIRGLPRILHVESELRLLCIWTKWIG